MTAPAPTPPDVKWRDVIAAGCAACGHTVTVGGAAPLTGPCFEIVVDGDHLWVTITQPCPCDGQP